MTRTSRYCEAHPGYRDNPCSQCAQAEVVWAIFPKGWGYDDLTDGRLNFQRATEDFLVRVTGEHAKPGHSIVYTERERRLQVQTDSLRP